MKRRKFFASIGLAAAATAVPKIAQAQDRQHFAHVQADYSCVAEEPYEFEELDEALTIEQFRMDITWE